ncbi:type VI secretion system baseplate subunit TssG [Massilia sp. YIM B02763]|uniref:type VI secretion system baseplate subunit TssG n=1 Tax=Massilia sp. YIM B02763 TaxID=3050130 RepID=UPI0025B7036C|nr:type VI secretion system baseplate subunit TssG [Massilia sp. YIM B02763]MDN4055610.1 type VI secretion system baseplate subunit TssG [Massilia sp. YIM B02763]
MEVIARLLADPQRFEFFQAVRLLQLWLGEHGVAPRQALDGHLRFPNSLSLAFPASEIERLAVERMPGGLPRFVLTPGFMGLLGAHGALPRDVTERILAWQGGEPDPELAAAPRAFLDMFSTRMLALFYGAWKKYRVELTAGGPDDAFLPLLLALAGLPPGALTGIDGKALAPYAGLLGRRPVSAAVLGRILCGHFSVPVRVVEGVGHWDRLLPAERSALGGGGGRPPAALGRAALLGERCWRPDLRVRVRIGPLDREGFARFLPHGARALRLRTLLGLFAAPALAYEVELVLRRADVPPPRLAQDGPRLGVDGWLLGGPATTDRADLRYELRPLGPLPPLPAGDRRGRAESP